MKVASKEGEKKNDNKSLKMGGSSAIVKYLLFVFNFVFFLMGCGILGIGIYLKVEKGDYAELSDLNYITASNVIIAAGVITTIVSFLGCCGAIKEIAPMLLTFFIFLLIVFIMEMGAGGYAYAKRNDLENKLAEEFKFAINHKYGQGNEEGFTKAIDKFQEEFSCCGYSNYTDYRLSVYTNRTSTIPKSCCKHKDTDLKCGSTSATLLNEVYNTKGCYDEVKKFLEEKLLLVAAVSIAFAVLQVLGMVLSMVLYCQIRDDNHGTMA